MCPAPDNNIAALLALVKPPIADQLVPEANAELFDRQSTERWIETLSTINYATNAIQLYRVLPSVIQLDSQPQTKMEILDSLMPTVLKSIEALVQNQLNQDTAKAISLGQALAKRLFEGYKLVIFQLGQTLKSESETNHEEEDAVLDIAKTILNACTLLSKIQLNSLSHYLQQPAYFWRELHTLYLLAERLGVANKNLSNSLGFDTSIKNVYIKLLLFSCTRPNHFSSYEMRFVYRELEFWSSFADLHRGGKSGLFTVDPSCNHGAVYSDECKKYHGSITLDTSHLVRFLNSLIGDSSNTLFSDRVSQRVIKDLTKQWGKKIKRQETHIKDHAQLSITHGLSSAVCMLSKTDCFEKFLRLCGQTSPSREHGGSGLRREEDAWGTIFETLDSHPDDPIIFTPKDKKNNRLEVVYGVRSNVSLSGACIELTNKTVQPQPGELIAIRSKGDNKWMAGIVRWKHISPSLNTICGVQFPARYCTPAAIRISPRGPNSDCQFLQAIILSKARDLSEGVTLLCPPLRYTEGSKIFIVTPLQNSAALLGEELETTEHLSHFKITFY